MTTLVDALRAAFGDRVQVAEPLSPFTTFKLGGPADTISFEVCTLADAMAALIAQERALMAVEVRRT